MTSIFPGGNAFKAADITNKQQNQSAEMMEKISVGKRVTNGADDAANLFNINNLQANVLSAYVFLAPAIVAGVVTLGVMQQIIRAFGRVEGSMQYLLKAWPTIIELASVYKRLREFEKQIILNGGDNKALIENEKS